MKEAQRSARRIVLVHGGFVDGSGWQGVYEVLRRDRYDVTIVQNPTISLDGDVAATRRVLSAQAGPAILVGHSYGGVVITEAGHHPTVAGLVYIAAFAPDRGESVAALIKDPAPGAPVPPIVPGEDGYLLLDKSRFAASFAADVAALTGVVGDPAWKHKPSWYLVATDDRMIPPPAQRAMAARAGAVVAEAPGSHAIYVSQPKTVADLIAQAARDAMADQVLVHS